MIAEPYRILIVEDEPIIAMQLGALVEELGCVAVGPAPDLQTARKLLADEKPDGAILDISLKGDNSLPIADELVRLGKPWIFTTGYIADDLESRYPDVPVVLKPFAFEQLGDLIVRMKLRRPLTGRVPASHRSGTLAVASARAR